MAIFGARSINRTLRRFDLRRHLGDARIDHPLGDTSTWLKGNPPLTGIGANAPELSVPPEQPPTFRSRLSPRSSRQRRSPLPVMRFGIGRETVDLGHCSTVLPDKGSYANDRRLA